MAITNVWDETFPSNVRKSNNGAGDSRRLSTSIREQLAEGNHWSISNINIEPGAVHVTSDSDSEFPIYVEEGSTVKIAGWQSNKRNFGDGVRLDHIHEERITVENIDDTRSLVDPLYYQLLIDLELDAVYTLEVRVVVFDNIAARHGAITITGAFSNAVLINTQESQANDGFAGITGKWEREFRGPRAALKLAHPNSTDYNAVILLRKIRVD